MRLRRLELTRYGRFTDQAIEFGPRPADGPDLHVVYGPNEAGKSTAVSGFLDLLFGIEPRSRYDFLHPYDAMRVGAVLEIGGARHALARVKRQQRSLLDAANQPVSEGVLLGALGGLGRDGYRAMFSLDDDTLEDGGESILASRGDVGELLFAASAGLARLSQALAALKGEADAFYRKQKHNTELNRLKAELARLKDARAAIDTGAVAHAGMADTLRQAAAAEQAAVAARAETRLRMERVQRLLGALPRLAALRAAREQLAALEGLPEVPPGWREELARLQARAAGLAEREAAGRAEIARARAALDGIVPDPAACAAAAGWEGLGGQRDRHVKALGDLPGLRRELAAAQARVDAALARIGCAGETDGARRLIDAPRRAALEGLIAARPEIAAALRAAEDEQADALLRFEAARKAVDGAGAARDATALAVAVAAAKDSDHAARARTAARAAEAERARLAAQRRALLPWEGTDDALAGLAMPDPGHLAGWRGALAQASAAQAQEAGRAEQLDGEIARLRADRQAIGAATGAVTDAEAAALRAAREGAWRAHLARLDAASAAAFEAALRADDAAVTGMLRHAGEIARLHAADAALARLAVEREGVAARLAAAGARRAAVAGALAAAARGLGLPADSSAERLEAWIAARAEALRAQAALAQADRDAGHAAADEAACGARLAAALGGMGLACDPAAGLAALLAQGEAALADAGRAAALREALAAGERDLALRQHAAQRAREADRRWQAAWAEACAATWLGEGGAAPGWETARGVLGALGGLEAALDAHAALARRIDDIEAGLAAFGRGVAAAAEALGMAADAPAPELAARVGARIAAALEARAAAAQAAQALAEAEGRAAELAGAQAAHAGRCAAMAAHFGVADLDAVAARMEEAARRDALRSRAAEAERDVLELLRVDRVAAAEAALDGADRAALEREAAELAPQAEAHDQDVRAQHARWRQARDALDAVGSREDAARLEGERRVVLLDIEERAHRHLRLLAGIAAAERALRAYRDRHRSAMMARASDAFRVISRGAYSGLAAQPGRDGEVLMAIPAAGGAKAAPDLSKGTRFQLYLALRVAGYHEYAATRTPVPFLADDIMETFDDDRSAEAFRLLGEMGQKGQVIYLTHHRHLCEAAARVVPGVRVHGLG